MTNKEAIRRILDHKRVHSLNEPRAVLINEALDEEPCRCCCYGDGLDNWEASDGGNT